MNRFPLRAILASVVLATLAGCAGKPAAPVALHESNANVSTDPDTHSADTNPNRIICRQPPPATGSHINQDKEICHTYAQWQIIEKQSQDAIRHGQHQPGQGTTYSH